MDDQTHAINRWVLNIERARANERALCAQREELERRIVAVVDYRNGLIAKRDRKASQIPLREAEKRMWETKIDLADQSIAALRAELDALN